jgi:hypothetical protein
MSTQYVFDTVEVEAYLRPNDIVLVSGSLCVGFEGFYERDWEVLPVGASPEALGLAAQRAFERCRVGVAEPPTMCDEFARSLGARHWTDLVSRMRRLSMGRSMRETNVDVRNTIRKGRNGAFGSFHRTVDLHDTQALGQAVWEALRTTT